MAQPYDEQFYITQVGPALAADYKEAGRTIGDDAQWVVWPARIENDVQVNGLSYAGSLLKHRNEWRVALGLKPLFPPAPSRDALMDVRVPFQGFTARTRQYGAFPAFGPETTTLADDDLVSYTQQAVSLPHPCGGTFTHTEIAVSWAYREAGFLMPVPGRDLSNDLGELTRRIALMLQSGATGVLLFMAGDGRSAPRNPDGTWPYNDPQGDTYGFEWLMANTARIWGAVIAAGLNRYVIPVPGYDAVFYGWGNLPSEPATPDLQPARVKQWLDLMRSIDPGVVIGFEHSAGNFPTGEGTANFDEGQPMFNCDVLLHEMDFSVHTDKTWQILARSAKPYNRPSDQPAGDDPNPPLFMPATSPRGPRRRAAYEWKTYPWTRGQCSAADCDADRIYLQALGPGSVC